MPGIRVEGSDDVSVVGFDNLEPSIHANPPLTTIDVPAAEMGEATAGCNLGRLRGKALSVHDTVEVNLILRASSAPPAAGASIGTRGIPA